MRAFARLAAIALALVMAAPASAQDATSVQRFDEGVEHLREGRHEDAAAAFRESYRLEPRVETMCNLALTYDRWGADHRAQAVRAYRACALEDARGRFGPFAQRRAVEIERDLVLDESRVAPPPEEAPEEAEPSAETTAEHPISETPPVRSGFDEGLLIAGSTLAGLGAIALVPAIVLALDAQSTVDALRAELGPMPTIVRGSQAHERLEDAESKAIAATALYVGAGIAAAAGITLVVIALVSSDDERDESSIAVAITPTPEGMSMAVAGRF